MEWRAEFGVFLTEECEDRTFDPETRMLPVNKNSGLVGIVAVLACTVLALALYHGVLQVTAAVMSAFLVLASILGGAVLACLFESSRRDPAERYRREHEPLAGPRPGARLET